MKNITVGEKRRLIYSYFEKFRDCYNEKQISKMIENFGHTFSDNMMQMYYYLGLLDNFDNQYQAFTDLLEKNIGLNHNFIEIGGGVYPAWADEISKRQVKCGCGSITVYDSLLGIEKLNNVKLIKENVTELTNIDSYDVILGKEPCMATELLIIRAKDEAKDFVVSPCGCYSLLPSYMEYDIHPVTQWYNYVEGLAAPRYLGDTLTKEFLNHTYHYDAPIFTYKKSK